MKFIELLRRDKKGPEEKVFVNAFHIVTVCAAIGGDGSLLSFDGANYLFVKESVDEVLSKIRGN